MSYIIDGNSNEVKGKGNLKKRASKFIDSIPKTLSLEKLNAVSYSSYQDIGSIITRAQVALKYISDFNTYSKIEFEKYNSTELPSNLPEMEVINKCYFFVSMIGLIDKHIVDCKQSVIHHAKFIDSDEYSAEAYYKAKNLASKLAVKREMILLGIKQTEILNKYRSTLPEICTKCFDKIPMFDGFSDLYKKLDINDTRDVQLASNFINAYNTGYNANCDNIELALAKHTELYNELHNHIKNDRKKVSAYVKRKNNN